MKFNARSFAIIAGILVLSIGFGFAFDGIATAIEKNRYPLSERYANDIRTVATEYGIPEVIIWATVHTKSGFVSNLEGDDGGIGLMQLTPDEFAMIQTDILKVTPGDKGLLYDPQKNLQCGTAYLSYLYQRYGVWETVFAALDAGTASVDAWLSNPEYVTELGTLKNIPNSQTARFVRDVMEAREFYIKLYFNN
jgi:soluble lytic murein transglycosylase-like protein